MGCGHGENLARPGIGPLEGTPGQKKSEGASGMDTPPSPITAGRNYWCMLVSAIVLSCIMFVVSIGMVSAGGVVSVVPLVVSSAFFAQLIAESANVSDSIAIITSAKFFRIVFPSPPLETARAGDTGRGSFLCSVQDPMKEKTPPVAVS